MSHEKPKLIKVDVQEIIRNYDARKPFRLDVLFIHIDQVHNAMLSYINTGILSMATLLEANGFKVKCLGASDLFFMSAPDLKKFLRFFRPRLVGFYTVSDNIYQVLDTARHVKSWLPGVRIILGGPQACVKWRIITRTWACTPCSW